MPPAAPDLPTGDPTPPGPAAAAFPPDFDAWVERLRVAFDVPGLAVAVMHQHTPHVRCYGVVRLGSPDPVGPRTMFPIGSNTKAITAACIGLLVDEGRLALDDRVRDHLPWFGMYDPVADAQITLRDLLLHRSGLGLGAGDLLIYPQTTLTRAEVVRAIGRIPPAAPFRSIYAYDNLLYIVLGTVIEQVTGQSWEDFVRTRIFAPLRMQDAVASGTDLHGTDFAWPHAKLDPPLRGTGRSRPMAEIPKIGSAAPAGGIYASAPAMTAWLSTLLNHGMAPGGRRLYSAAVAEQLLTPQIDVPLDEDWPGFAQLRPQRQGYGLGLLVQDWNGERIISHGGAILGGVSHLVLAPAREFAAIVMANTDGSICARAVALQLLDLQLQQGGDRLQAAAALVRTARRKAREIAKPGREIEFVSQRDPGDYIGHYQDCWYGPARVELRSSRLTLSLEHSPGMAAPLQAIGDDRFVARWHDVLAEPAEITFHRAGELVVRMTLTAESPFADFSFDFKDLDFARMF